jgi:AraC-like DNA-binding protein
MFRKDDMLFYYFDADKISDEITVCNIGYEKCKPCHSFGPYTRDHWLFHIVLSGSGVFKKDGYVKEVGKGQAFLIRPGEITTYTASASDPWRYVWLGFKDTAAASKLMDENFSSEESVFNINPDFGYELESIYKSYEGDEDLLYRVTSMAYKLLGELRLRKQNKVKRPQETIKSAVSFIEYNYNREIDISWLAGELGLSRGHFTALFTKAMGVSPYNYITKYRIVKAQTLLLSSSLNVSEIAYAVGFNSVSRFDGMFQKYVGVSPSVYRDREANPNYD